MKYKIIKTVELDTKNDLFVSAVAQCMLDLLYKRLIDEDVPEFLKNDNLDINYDFSLFDDGLLEVRENKGYSNDKFIDLADTFVRRL